MLEISVASVFRINPQTIAAGLFPQPVIQLPTLPFLPAYTSSHSYIFSVYIIVSIAITAIVSSSYVSAYNSLTYPLVALAWLDQTNLR